MAVITIVCVAIGIVTGLLTGFGILYQVAFGILGAFVGPPITFAVNILWALRR